MLSLWGWTHALGRYCYVPPEPIIKTMKLGNRTVKDIFEPSKNYAPNEFHKKTLILKRLEASSGTDNNRHLMLKQKKKLYLILYTGISRHNLRHNVSVI